MLYEREYQNTIGLDFSENMILRGRKIFPHLDLRLLEEALYFPFPDATADSIILSTVMTCIPDTDDLKRLISDAYRVLKNDGRIYVSDFLVTPSEKYLPLYQKYKADFLNYGTFMTSEGGVVRHFQKDFIASLFHEFESDWFKEVDFVTMNGNPINTFHLIVSKKV